MSQLEASGHGLIVVHAGVTIAALDSGDVHHVAAVAALGDGLDRGDRLIHPASACAESLVGPSRRGPDAVATLDAFLDAMLATVEPATREIVSGLEWLGLSGPVREPDPSALSIWMD